MATGYYRAESRKEWYGAEDVTVEQINCGSLQRLADAAEKMARNHQQLIDERDQYKRWYEERTESRNRQYRRIAALQGVITKLKKQLAEAQTKRETV